MCVCLTSSFQTFSEVRQVPSKVGRRIDFFKFGEAFSVHARGALVTNFFYYYYYYTITTNLPRTVAPGRVSASVLSTIRLLSPFRSRCLAAAAR